MTREEIIQAISDDKMMPFIQPEQLAGIVDFVIKNYKPSLPSNLDEAAKREIERFCSDILNVDIIWARMPLTKRFGLQMAKAGAEWMAGQGVTIRKKIGKIDDGVNQIPTYCNGFEITELDVPFLNSKECGYGNEVIVQIRNKQ